MSVAEKTIPVKTATPLDVEKIRQDFPILRELIHGKPLIYLDNAATTQKPLFVIDSLHHYYRSQNANIHRGTHYLSQVATFEYEKRAGRSASSSMRKTTKKLFLSEEPPKPSILFLIHMDVNILRPAMRSLFLRWNIIRILFPGNSYANIPVQNCASFR